MNNTTREKPNREFYDAFCAMRNDLNEIFGDMPSQEAALLQGPEMIHETSALVEALRTRLNALIGAAYEAAAEEANERWYDDGADASPAGMCSSIRAKAPADAIAALEQVKVTTRDAGFEAGREQGFNEGRSMAQMDEQMEDVLEAAIRESERERCAKKAEHVLQEYAAEKGYTKTPGGRTAIFYKRKVAAAIRGDSDE